MKKKCIENALRGALCELVWNNRNKELFIIDQLTCYPTEVESFDDLILYLNEIAYEAAGKKQVSGRSNKNDNHQFSKLIYNLLNEYKKQLSDIGWDKHLREYVS
jgi:NTP pyrophosphatase (non-canonical NTP hydrolase)